MADLSFVLPSSRLPRTPNNHQIYISVYIEKYQLPEIWWVRGNWPLYLFGAGTWNRSGLALTDRATEEQEHTRPKNLYNVTIWQIRVIRWLSKLFRYLLQKRLTNTLCASYATFWNLISTAMSRDYVHNVFYEFTNVFFCSKKHLMKIRFPRITGLKYPTNTRDRNRSIYIYIIVIIITITTTIIIIIIIYIYI